MTGGRLGDGPAKARGAAEFVADGGRRPHLFGGLLTTRSAHCRVRVDLDGLRSLPGVVVALDHTAAPGRHYSTNPHGGTADTRVFSDVGRYAGDVVGAIACADRTSLRRALERSATFVHETPQPAVLSLDMALTGTAVANPRFPGNLIAEVTIGAPAARVGGAVAAAPHRHTTVSAFDPAPHGFLERLAAMAERVDGRWLVRSPSQCPGLVRPILAEMFGAEVDLEPVFLGGGFGGKEELTVEPAAILLSAAAGGQRILLETTRQQMTGHYRARHGGRIEVTTGFDDDGRFLARIVDILFEAGPYDGHSSGVAANAGACAARLYPRTLVHARARAVATNRLPGGAFRGYGCIQATFALETHVDEIARQLRLDGFEIRLINAARDGDTDPVTGRPLRDVRAVECLGLLRAMAGPPPARPRGAGVALVVTTGAMADADRPDRAEVACRFEPSAESVVVETGVAEAGQGLHPMLVRLAARTLGIDEERVTVEHVTGAGAPRDPGMFGSRGANVTGSALVRAAAQLRAAILAQALAKSGGATAEIDRDWRFVRCGQTEIKLSELNPERVIAGYETADPAIAYGAQHATVHCDRRTGEVHVEQVSAVHDLGMVLDEDGARAQVEGGIAQGIGAALSELVTFAADGSVLQTGFVNHLVPTAVGQARTDIRFLAGRDDPPQRTGAKGIGEAAIMGVPAAIANAVGAVAAARITQLPLTPERVLRTLDASAAAQPAGGQR